MRTTVTIDDDTFKRAAELTGAHKPSEVLRLALKEYIRIESSRRLASLAGSIPSATTPPRNRKPVYVDD